MIMLNLILASLSRFEYLTSPLTAFVVTLSASTYNEAEGSVWVRKKRDQQRGSRAAMTMNAA
jgi:hypothetical protein